MKLVALREVGLVEVLRRDGVAVVVPARLAAVGREVLQVREHERPAGRVRALEAPEALRGVGPGEHRVFSRELGGAACRHAPRQPVATTGICNALPAGRSAGPAGC